MTASSLGRAELAAWVLLALVPGVGPVSAARLVARFGSAAAVAERARGPGGAAALVEATAGEEGGRPSLGAADAAALAAAAGDPERLLGRLDAAGVVPLALADQRYPARLRAIDLPPPVLFVRGDAASLAGRVAVAVVGTRRPSPAGVAAADAVGTALARAGAVVVSGLALGIDAAVHAAAVRARAPTVAVLGGGHDRLHPPSHRGLAAAILRHGGALAGEFAPGVAPSRGTFPRRNRILSGLADAVVVVEAGERSGALVTAAWALEQGRPVHVLPGRIGDPAVAGSLAFLHDWPGEARVVASVAGLLEDLGLAGTRTRDAPAADEAGAPLGEAERRVAGALGDGADLDALVARTDLAPATVLGVLTGLELRGLVVDAFGRYVPAGALLAGRSGPRPGPRDRPGPRP